VVKREGKEKETNVTQIVRPRDTEAMQGNRCPWVLHVASLLSPYTARLSSARAVPRLSCAHYGSVSARRPRNSLRERHHISLSYISLFLYSACTQAVKLMFITLHFVCSCAAHGHTYISISSMRLCLEVPLFECRLDQSCISRF
jgi:hypothetical protein